MKNDIDQYYAKISNKNWRYQSKNFDILTLHSSNLLNNSWHKWSPNKLKASIQSDVYHASPGTTYFLQTILNNKEKSKLKKSCSSDSISNFTWL